MTSSDDKLDKLLDACQDISIRMASVERTIEEWRINIQRFYDVTMPAMQKQVDKTEERVDLIEKEVAGLRGRMAVIGGAVGAAGAASVTWLKHLFGN